MLRPSCIDPTKLAYEVIHGLYNWNRFPLAPPGCKAVIYESPKARTLWGSHGTDAWYVVPLLDHYRCNHYFVPETHVYRISGLVELFPQHCQVPCLMWNKHLQDVINELVTMLNKLSLEKRTRILTKVQQRIASPMCDHSGRALTHKSHDWLLNVSSTTEPIWRHIGSVVELMFNKSVILRVRTVGPAIITLSSSTFSLHYTPFLHPSEDASFCKHWKVLCHKSYLKWDLNSWWELYPVLLVQYSLALPLSHQDVVMAQW
jgi:hypothetical protein